MRRLLVFLRSLLVTSLLAPYALLLVMTIGSGWTYPGLVPDRIDFAPWQRLASDREGLIRSIALSLSISGLVGATATAVGLFAGRALRRTTSRFARLILYLPFAASPVVVGVTLYDLMVRVQLAGTALGVIALQGIFASAMATIYFSSSWSSRTDRLEQMVRTLGGGRWSVWRHAIWPRSKGLVQVCFVQTALYSWIDYGFAATIGGGQVQTVTLRLFAYLREANVNQAALASLVLFVPALVGCIVSGLATINHKESPDHGASNPGRSLFREVG
mgnify:CR=1 FL=1